MIKNQKIRVNTKKGLIVAFECAKNFPGTTEITLVRKSGESIYKVRPFDIKYYINDLPYIILISFPKQKTKNNFNRFIQKTQNKIKQIKATDLLA